MVTNRKYLIFDLSEVNMIDFSQIQQPSAESLRKSVDGTKAVIKWEGETPSFVGALQTKSDIYNIEGILPIMDGPEWTEIEEIK